MRLITYSICVGADARDFTNFVSVKFASEEVVNGIVILVDNAETFVLEFASLLAQSLEDHFEFVFGSIGY